MVNAYPDGIGPQHCGGDKPAVTRWLGLAVLGLFVAIGMSGQLGGGVKEVRTAERGGVRLAAEAPAILRPGEIFEIWIGVQGERPIAQPTIAFFSPYMRNLTINTIMPEPAEHGFADGAFMLTYDRLEAGKELRIKLDGQVNPTLSGGHDGWIELRDGEAVLARIPLEQRILP